MVARDEGSLAAPRRRDLRQSSAARVVIGSEADAVLADAAGALGRHVVDAVAVQVAIPLRRGLGRIGRRERNGSRREHARHPALIVGCRRSILTVAPTGARRVDIGNRRGRALLHDHGDAFVRRGRVRKRFLVVRVAVALDPVAAVPQIPSGGAEAEDEGSGGLHWCFWRDWQRLGQRYALLRKAAKHSVHKHTPHSVPTHF